MIDPNGIPQTAKETLDLYVSDRIPTGGFLEAVLSNDLAGAVGRADPVNLTHLPEIVSYVYNELPGSCWGSRAAVKAWLGGES